MVIAYKEALLLGLSDGFVEGLNGELAVFFLDGLQVNFFCVVRGLGVEIQVHRLNVREAVGRALVKAEWNVLLICKGHLVGGDGDKLVVGQVCDVVNVGVLGKCYGGVALVLVGLLDLLGGLSAVGKRCVAVHIYLVKLAALGQ